MGSFEMVRRILNIFGIFKTAVTDFFDDKASRLAAALAYYGIFSLAPMLLIAVVIAGFVLGDEGEARREIFLQTEEWMGEDAADLIDGLLSRVAASRPQSLTLGALVALATLIWAGTGLFANLHGALNHIWEVEPANGGVLRFFEKRAVSFLMVILLGVLLILLLVSNTAINILVGYFSDILPVPGSLVQAASILVSFLLLTLLFALIYKILPDVKVAWADVWIGAVITAVLFAVGVQLVGLYFSYGSPGGAAAAAASIIALIVWIYYSAQIVLFGAELTQVVANRYGSGIVPEEGYRYRPGAKRIAADRVDEAGGEAPAQGKPPGRREAPARGETPALGEESLPTPLVLAAWVMGLLGVSAGTLLGAVGALVFGRLGRRRRRA